MKDAQTHVDPLLAGLRRWLASLWTPANRRRALLVLAFAFAYAAIYRFQATLPLPPALDPAGALLLASCLLLPPRAGGRTCSRQPSSRSGSLGYSACQRRLGW